MSLLRKEPVATSTGSLENSIGNIRVDLIYLSNKMHFYMSNLSLKVNYLYFALCNTMFNMMIYHPLASKLVEIFPSAFCLSFRPPRDKRNMEYAISGWLVPVHHLQLLPYLIFILLP